MFGNMDRRHFVSALAGAAALPAAAAAASSSPTLAPRFASGAIRRLLDAADVAKDRGVRLFEPNAPAWQGNAAADAAFAADEDFWEPIQRAFELDRSWINLNNGGCSPAPTHVMDQMIRDLHYSNELPVIQMWRDLEPRVEIVRRELAAEFGCDVEEMAITRNTTESLTALIFGIDLKAGDEVIVSNQNYPRMLNAWRQRARRDGIVLKEISFPVSPSNINLITEKFAAAITPRTKVIEITHITNLTGQILPVHDIVAMARAKNIDVFVDGAHAFAQFPFTRDQLGVDYYGTSLHKWMLAPIGTGFLYVRKDKQKKIWPLIGADVTQDDNIRKFEEIGTHPAANHNAISVAIAFHRAIGTSRKFARLVYLRDRWAKRLLAEGNGRVKMLTPMDSPWGGGIGNFSVDGMDPAKLGNWLHGTHRIVQTPIVHAEFSGIRITPNVYTSINEIDRFADLVLTAMRSGLT